MQPSAETVNPELDKGDKEAQVVARFAYKVRPDINQAELSGLWHAMHDLVRSDPAFGYRGEESYKAEDGTRLIMYHFSSLAGLRLWQRQPEHLAVKRRGGEFFEWIRIEISTVLLSYRWVPES